MRNKAGSVSVVGRQVLGWIHSSASDKLRQVIVPRMRDDEVLRSIRYDKLVIAYGNQMCSKYQNSSGYKEIRAKLRLLGRFFISIRLNNLGITEFASIYDPKFYDAVKEAVNDVAKFNKSTGSYGKPANASTLGTRIKFVGSLYETMCITEHNEDEQKNTCHFLNLLR